MLSLLFEFNIVLIRSRMQTRIGTKPQTLFAWYLPCPSLNQDLAAQIFSEQSQPTEASFNWRPSRKLLLFCIVLSTRLQTMCTLCKMMTSNLGRPPTFTAVYSHPISATSPHLSTAVAVKLFNSLIWSDKHTSRPRFACLLCTHLAS